MSDQCRCCGGRCGGELLEITRREFLGEVTVGAAGLVLLGDLPWAHAGQTPRLLPPRRPGLWQAYPWTPPRVYRGKNLEAVGMPIGGIGTGSVWLDGQGRLGIWQIFNNLSEPRIPDSFFAVRARRQSGQAVTRVLQTTPEGSLAAVESLEYEGGYPIARLTFHDAALPVEVLLEAMNPMIPLDAANSSIPCALFRLTAKNAGPAAGRRDAGGHAAKRGGQQRGQRHSLRAPRRIRREPQPRGPRQEPRSPWPWTSRPTRWPPDR